MTRRGCQEITKTIFGIAISLGSVCRLHQEVSESLAPTHAQIKQTLPQQPVLNVDETGWSTQGNRRWLWHLTTPVVAFFHVTASRGAKVLKGILGDEYKGTLCSDMYSAYDAYHKRTGQLCWAHLIRGIKGIKHGCRSPDVAKTTKSLLKHWHSLFTFLEYDGVEPTNNAAERGLRPAVMWRKICFANQSDDGELLTARVLTAERSCILQGRNAFRFLVESINAFRQNLPAPSWLQPSR